MDQGQPNPKPLRVLSLDGGGAKGFYTLGVLKEIEAMIGCPLWQKFDLVYGTSTGAIIAALVCLGHPVDDMLALYRKHVVRVMRSWLPSKKTAALEALSAEVFENKDFSAFKTDIGIVCTDWDSDRPKIFKTNKRQAYRQVASFVPGFGCKIGEAVHASCSAYPFFWKKTIVTPSGERYELADGGFCANNPALYAIADATHSLGHARQDVRVVSIGVGEYPAPRRHLLHPGRWIGYLFTVRLLQKTLEINTQSMDQLRTVLFGDDVPTIRISKAYTEPEMATDLFEHDPDKLDKLWQRGRRSYAEYEPQLKAFLL
jgi:predicted acylesterase/phospholipase RssA